MTKKFRMPPPPIYSSEEMLEIGMAMERLGETMDRIRKKEEKALRNKKARGENK